MAILDISKANHYPILELGEDKIFVPGSLTGQYDLMVFDKKTDKFVLEKEKFTFNFTKVGNSSIRISYIKTEGSNKEKFFLSRNELSSLNKKLNQNFSDENGKTLFFEQLVKNQSINTVIASQSISTSLEKAPNSPESIQPEARTNDPVLVGNPSSSVSSNTSVASKEFKNFNKNDIKELFKKACQKDNQQEAQEAENLLFDLYTVNKDNKNLSKFETKKYYPLQEYLGKESLRYYEKHKLCLPNKLLIIAGFHNKKSEHDQMIGKIESGLDEILPLYMNFSESDVKEDLIVSERLSSSFNFNDDRFLNHCEIAFFCAELSKKSRQFKFLEPRCLPTSKDNLIEELKIPHHDISDKNKIYGNFVPLLFRTNHWVLFGVFSKGNKKTAVLFDSLNYLNDNELKEIKELSDKLVAKPDDPGHIKKNLQKNAPNACGIFVQKAMELIAEDSNIEPNITLSRFADGFIKMPKEQQEMFNKSRRALSYSKLLDAAESLKEFFQNDSLRQIERESESHVIGN
ncbi:hypothetical protein GWK90_08620 [Candidatus Hamiltonella defensa]|uniref:SseL-like C-terminal domain-containing protein n=1 Tax=Candidatus Williamhamiltonella defendens TaxID=138072 RepID=A0AAC9YGB5_9ENTR|nr:Ulp1 family isopeptidase [Candidatus Hamiltonella defensa]ASV34065.1 hypothetical protein CJJ18_08885 [Candidatus Hamiltonella defensa]AWK17022.1 hypothetical protein CCS40_08705 [Candidatus Hamiltonella defensa]MBK4362246.1 hypothetical protein [Candidatus Hamiltonella defensa]